MKARFCFCILCGLNLALVVLGWLLLSLYRQEHTATQSLRADLNQIGNELGLERSRAGDRDCVLKNLACLLTDLQHRQPADTRDLTREDAVEAGQIDAVVLSRLSLLSVPLDGDTTARLPEEKLQQLRTKWRQLDADVKRAAYKFENGVDVDAVLADPLWNPTGRSLSMTERVDLAVELRNLRYFSTTLPFSSLHTIIRPEADRLRELKQYVEYSGDPPLLPDGVRLSHAEPTGVDGVDRMYYFSEQDYPELYHRWYVGSEQTLKARVTIYEIINAPVVPDKQG